MHLQPQKQTQRERENVREWRERREREIESANTAASNVCTDADWA